MCVCVCVCVCVCCFSRVIVPIYTEIELFQPAASLFVPLYRAFAACDDTSKTVEGAHSGFPITV